MLKEASNKRKVYSRNININRKPYKYRIRKKENMTIGIEEDICFTKEEVDFVLNNLELFF